MALPSARSFAHTLLAERGCKDSPLPRMGFFFYGIAIHIYCEDRQPPYIHAPFPGALRFAGPVREHDVGCTVVDGRGPDWTAGILKGWAGHESLADHHTRLVT